MNCLLSVTKSIASPNRLGRKQRALFVSTLLLAVGSWGYAAGPKSVAFTAQATLPQVEPARQERVQAQVEQKAVQAQAARRMDPSKQAVPLPKREQAEQRVVPAFRRVRPEQTAIPAPKRTQVEQTAVPAPKRANAGPSAVPAAPLRAQPEKPVVPAPKKKQK